MFGTTDDSHPGVDQLLNRTQPVCLGGRLEGLARPTEYDFRQLRDEPEDLRHKFEQRGWTRVVAFQTRNPMHRAHQELTQRAAQIAEANLLIHPVVGMTKPGDVDHFVRVRCYEHLLKTYPEQTTLLSLLPLAMRMAGPREAVWHAIIRKNHGCSHFIVGRDHAGPGNDRSGKPFYGPYDAQALMRELEPELGVQMVPFQEMVYVQDRGQYVPRDEVERGETVLSLSGTELRRRLREGIDIPAWFTYPQVVEELRRSYPPRAPPGLHGAVHRALGRRQVDARERPDGQAHGAGRPLGDAARWRPGAQAPLQRARLLQGASRSQRPAHRLRRERDHQGRRGRALRADRALRRDPPPGARADRGPWRLRRDPRRDLARASASSATPRASTPRRAPG